MSHLEVRILSLVLLTLSWLFCWPSWCRCLSGSLSLTTTAAPGHASVSRDIWKSSGHPLELQMGHWILTQSPQLLGDNSRFPCLEATPGLARQSGKSCRPQPGSHKASARKPVTPASTANLARTSSQAGSLDVPAWASILSPERAWKGAAGAQTHCSS